MLGCTGCGRSTQSVKSLNRPWCVAASWVHSARSAVTASSVRAPRSAKGTPMASNSSFSQPTPIPSSRRPPESWSSVAVSLASTTGLRWGRTRMPVASRMALVAAAT